MSKDYLIEVRVKNNHLVKAMQREGVNAAIISREIGSSYGYVLNMINLKTSPVDTEGKWKVVALLIADFLKELPEDLWPEIHRKVVLKKNRASVEASFNEIERLTHAQDPEYQFMQKQTREKIEEALTSLEPRDADIIRRRFGLDGDTETLRDLSETHNVGPERIRQLERTGHPKAAAPSEEIARCIAIPETATGSGQRSELKRGAAGNGRRVAGADMADIQNIK